MVSESGIRDHSAKSKNLHPMPKSENLLLGSSGLPVEISKKVPAKPDTFFVGTAIKPDCGSSPQ
jgi:hypothetical protein